MSLEQTIAALVAQTTLALSLPQTITDLAGQKVNEIGGAYQARIANLSATVFIDAALGDDANDGTIAHPKKTLPAVILAYPRGSLIYVKLLSDIDIDGTVYLRGRNLHISSEGAKRQVRAVAGTSGGGSPFRIMGGFGFTAAGETLAFYNIKLVLPSTPGAYSAQPDLGASAFARTAETAGAVLCLLLGSCDLDIPADCYGYLLGNVFCATLSFNSIVATNQPLFGRLVQGYSNLAGTPSSTVTFLTTNLAQV